MKTTTFSDAVERSRTIRNRYHHLELTYHGTKWTVEEDALAFLTDAGLVGRLTMAQQGRWPSEKTTVHELKHKLGECMWWLIVLAERMEIDVESALEAFLSKTEMQLEQSIPKPQSRTKANPRKRA